MGLRIAVVAFCFLFLNGESWQGAFPTTPPKKTFRIVPVLPGQRFPGVNMNMEYSLYISGFHDITDAYGRRMTVGDIPSMYRGGCFARDGKQVINLSMDDPEHLSGGQAKVILDGFRAGADPRAETVLFLRMSREWYDKNWRKLQD